MIEELIKQAISRAEKNLRNPSVSTDELYMVCYCDNTAPNLLFADDKQFHKAKYLGHMLDLKQNRDVLNFLTSEGTIISLYAVDFGARWFAEPVNTFLGINLDIQYQEIVRQEGIRTIDLKNVSLKVVPHIA